MTRAIVALREDEDARLIDAVAADEREINHMQSTIDQQCAQIIARRQPTAVDLRMIMMVTKIVNDLERIGDEAKKIGMLAMELTEEGPSPRGYHELRHIGAAVREMLHDSLDALARLDVATALGVVRRDKTVRAPETEKMT